jgi:thiamine biosynthesis lipoprotein
MALEPGVGVCINAGGDLRVEGPEAMPIRLAAPSVDASVPMLHLENGSLASSSGAESSRRCGRRRVGPHVGRLVPGRGRGPMGLRRFVSVLARECVTADALTKIVMAEGTDAAPLLARFRASALILDAGADWQKIGPDWRDLGADA